MAIVALRVARSTLPRALYLDMARLTTRGLVREAGDPRSGLDSAAGWAVLAVFDDLAHIVDAGIAGGVNFKHVDVIPARDGQA